MHALIAFPRVLVRLGALLMFALPLAATGLPAAYAAGSAVALTQPVGQSSSVGRDVVNTSVAPMGTCHDGDRHVCETR